MIYEFQVLLLDRKTSEPVADKDSTPPCVEVNGQLLSELFKLIGKDDGITFNMSIFAQVIGEMLGADVYYRPKGFSTWKFEKGFLPKAAQFRSRSAINKQATVIARVLEQVDSRAMAVDGPVTPTKDAIRADEFRKLYVAAKLIIEACVEDKPNGN